MLPQAIHGFRETERVQWGAACEAVIRRLRAHAFPQGSSLLGPVHVLDLDKAGFIKPHIDSVKVCFRNGQCRLHNSFVLNEMD